MFALTVAASAGARVAPSTGESPYRASRALSSRSAPPGDYPRGAPDISRIKFVSMRFVGGADLREPPG